MQKNISNIVLIFFITIFIFYPLQGMEKDGLCSICYMNMTSEKPTITLSCNHLFHSECLVDWVARKKMKTDCPFCRSEIFTSSIRVIADGPEHKDIVTSGSNYLKSYVTVLKKPSTYKPLLLPAISLSLPWLLLDRDVSRNALITKGFVAAGTYCLLTPYGTNQRFRWFSFERPKRIVGCTLGWAGVSLYANRMSFDKNKLISHLIFGLIVSGIMESILIIAPNKNAFYKTVDQRGCCVVAGYVVPIALEKLVKFLCT